ncbi:MAG: type I-E CRISPR-associated protein Cse1/CasA [Sutterellaceae bacterium]|nr:type I-E CRISPR-associated protein Cse1/CasA [Burkholderiaceae bacterium]MDW8430086.1 type I-E CRISPR-associated protein Cse1/CasA [Sutterellaceae bacterium]
MLEERWIPIRRASGRRERIAPHQVTDGIDTDPVVALDAPRPDFNGALIQFLIGLVQTAWVLRDQDWDREEMLWSPPPPVELERMFAPLKEAFQFDGDGPRFMQDLTLKPTDDPAQNEISALLIDFPGAQAFEKNADHFVKRDSAGAMCPHCAATALFCLMTNAPSGGVGHRTSLRGGGPLTTLVTYVPVTLEHPPSALWRDVACNILERSAFVGWKQRPCLADVFPWMQAIDQTMGRSGEVQPNDVSPLQVFWAMPRRIRLHFPGSGAGTCALCGLQTSQLITHYDTKNYGLNYKGCWQHPLSPYYRSRPKDPLLPVHPQPDGMTYRHWLGWVLGSKRPGREVVPAKAVQSFHSSRVEPGQLRLWAFGYDMDNMKARCWYETTLPLFDLPLDRRGAADGNDVVVGIVDRLISAAEYVVFSLRLAVRDAWSANGELRGDLGFVEASFWNRTEQAFFAIVERAIRLVRQHGRDADDLSTPLRREWLETLRRAALRIFDEVAARGSVEAGNPTRLAAAYRGLRQRLYGDELQRTLGLIPASAGAAPGKRRARGRKTPANTETT